MTDPAVALIWFVLAALMVGGVIGGGVLMAVRAANAPDRPDRQPDVPPVQPGAPHPG